MIQRGCISYNRYASLAAIQLDCLTPRHESGKRRHINQTAQDPSDRPVRVVDKRLSDDNLVREGNAFERVERDAGGERSDGPCEKDDGQGHDGASALSD